MDEQLKLGFRRENLILLVQQHKLNLAYEGARETGDEPLYLLDCLTASEPFWQVYEHAEYILQTMGPHARPQMAMRLRSEDLEVRKTAFERLAGRVRHLEGDGEATGLMRLELEQELERLKADFPALSDWCDKQQEYLDRDLHGYAEDVQKALAEASA